MVEQRNLGWTELRSGDLRIDQQVGRDQPCHLVTARNRHVTTCQQLLLPKHNRSAHAILGRRLPGIASAARKALRTDFGRTVHLHLSLGAAGPAEEAGEHDLGEVSDLSFLRGER